MKVDLHAEQPRRAPQPNLRTAVGGDLRLAGRALADDGATARNLLGRGLRLAVTNRALQGLIAYRLQVHFAERGRPQVSRAFHWLAIWRGQICIGRAVVLEPGVSIPEGRVVLDGRIHVASEVVIGPETTLGLREGSFAAPRIGRGTTIGRRVSILGGVTIGGGARILENSVVLNNVAAYTTVAGRPATPVISPAAPVISPATPAISPAAPFRSAQQTT